jgi:hypothetical protein
VWGSIIGCMGGVFLGSEALARRELTRGQLRWNYRTIYPDVYQPRAAAWSLRANTVGAWLWSGRRAVITGRAAAALHGARWVDEAAEIELIWQNNHPPPGIITRNERFGYDEIIDIEGMPVATPQRTAFDLGRHLPRRAAVAHLDALARATGLSGAHVLPLADNYRGARGVRQLRSALELMDPGAQSPRETWLRILLVDAGFPRPTTQIPVLDRSGCALAYLDLGWEDVMVAAEYDGDQHRTDRRQYVKDIDRLRQLEQRGWIVVRVVAEDRPNAIIDRVRAAWAQRETEARVAHTPLSAAVNSVSA